MNDPTPNPAHPEESPTPSSCEDFGSYLSEDSIPAETQNSEDPIPADTNSKHSHFSQDALKSTLLTRISTLAQKFSSFHLDPGVFHQALRQNHFSPKAAEDNINDHILTLLETNSLLDLDLHLELMLVEVGVGVALPKNPPSLNSCLICDEPHPPNHLTHAGCHHHFCAQCYTSYLSQKISQGPSCLL